MLAVFIVQPFKLNDFEIYAKAGKCILNNCNPYLDPNYRSGVVTSILLSLLTHIPNFLLISSIFFLDLTTLFLLIKFERFRSPHQSKDTIYLLIFIILTEFFRSLIWDMQITLLIGLLAYLIDFLQGKKTKNLRSIPRILIISTGFVFLIDVRPQFGLIFLFLFLAKYRRFEYLFSSVLLYAISYLLIDKINKNDLLKSQFIQLKLNAKVSLLGGDSTSPLRIVFSLCHNIFLVNLLSFGIIVLLLYLMSSRNVNNIVLGAGICTLFFSYVHPYDFIFLGIFLGQKFFETKNTFLLTIAFLISTSPASQNFQQNMLYLSMSVIFLAFFAVQKRIIVFSALLYIPIFLVNASMHLELTSYHSIKFSEILFLSIYAELKKCFPSQWQELRLFSI
jgi:hypothetical protein